MYSKLLAAAAIGAMISTAAIAQNSKFTENASAKGEWQASKLIHMNVYNDQNEKIGDIKELMVDKSGKIDAVAIGVGGLLGMGERDVAVKFDQLKWVNTPVSATTGSNVSGRATTTGTTQTESEANTHRNYPDHAVLDATKDQLKSMPQFDYNK
jgi:sporulation protein YlmC with PRC-barrel domain